MQDLPWYVLTGGPSSGKTTILERLRDKGHKVVQEAARNLILSYKNRGISVRNLRADQVGFEKRVLQMKIEAEKKAPRDKIVFFDRGMPDSIAYYQIAGLDSKEAENACINRYRKVFFFEQLKLRQDYARIEDPETIERLTELLVETYERLGYEIIRVPVMPVERRLKLVLANIDGLHICKRDSEKPTRQVFGKCK